MNKSNKGNKGNKGNMEKVSTVGIDLAKNTFQLCAMIRSGRVVKNKKVSRSKLLSTLDALDVTSDLLVAMESCGGPNHVARTLRAKGYQVKLIHAKFVKPFVKSNKNDAKDAEAIAEAARRPNMRFVGVKSQRQQDIQSIHRVREGFVKRKTALANEIRGLLLEYGVTIPQGILYLRKEIPKILEDADSGLSADFRELLRGLREELVGCFDKVEHYDKKLQIIFQSDEDCKRLGKVDGVGVITATALVAAVGDPSAFKNGRQFSAWLGLTPRQVSTGGKTKLLGISKRGDCYLRKNLIHGCRAVVRYAKNKKDKRSDWINANLPAKGSNKVAVAIANRTARAIWVVLARKVEYISPGQTFNSVQIAG